MSISFLGNVALKLLNANRQLILLLCGGSYMLRNEKAVNIRDSSIQLII